jgi:hypothetical protein
MHQNGVAFHAAHGMLNQDPDLTQGGMGSFLLIAQWWHRVLFALARLLGWDVNPITSVVCFNAKIAQINPHMQVCKPVQLRRKLCFSQAVIVMVTTKRPPQKDDKLVKERHDGVLQRMLFFFHWNAHVVWHHLLNDDRRVQWHQ